MKFALVICLSKLSGSYLGQSSALVRDVTWVWDQTDVREVAQGGCGASTNQPRMQGLDPGGIYIYF